MGLGEDQGHAFHMVDLANGSGGRVRSFRDNAAGSGHRPDCYGGMFLHPTPLT
jgi:hypothetical protein